MAALGQPQGLPLRRRAKNRIFHSFSRRGLLSAAAQRLPRSLRLKLALMGQRPGSGGLPRGGFSSPEKLAKKMLDKLAVLE